LVDAKIAGANADITKKAATLDKNTDLGRL
jgi:hypothetical protein